MSHIITLAIIFAVYYFYRVYKASVEEKEAEEYRFVEEINNVDNNEGKEMEEGKCLDERTITGLVLSTLRKMGCEPNSEQRDKNNWIYFTCQGEKYTIECNDESDFITIYDTWWYQISIYSDVEEIANLHKTVNLANQYASCTLLYTTNKEIEQIGVHSKQKLLFIKQIPELDKYLLSVLSDFFRVQRFVLTELEKCKVTENNYNL